MDLNVNIRNQGFTLVELSIVIVIIGLIVAGVVGGQNLVNQAKLRQAIAMFNKVDLSLNAFKLEYNGLPGDIDNGSDFFPSTVDGNGNSRINYFDGNEALTAWRQLSLADLIEGDYTGAGIPGGNTHSVGVNCPAFPIGQGDTGISFHWDNLNNASGAPINNNTLIIGTVEIPNHTRTPSLYIQDMHNIDQKMDDGIPSTGRFLGGHTGGCFDGTHPNTTYDLDDTTTLCMGQYVLPIR